MNKNEKLALLNSCDSVVDKAVKIARANYDRRRKVTQSMCTKMSKELSNGKAPKQVASAFGVSTYTVNYNTDEDFRTSERERKKSFTTSPSENNLHDRANYKRELVSAGKHLTTWVK